MKQLKVTFLFYLILFNFSCNKKEGISVVKEPFLDSISFYTKKMRSKSIEDSTRLEYSNKALHFAKSRNSKKVEILSYKAYLLGKLKHFDSVIYTSQELLKKSIKENDSAKIGRAYFNLAYYHNINERRDSAYYYYKLAKDIYIKRKDSLTSGRIHLGLAIIQSDFGDYSGSDNSAIQALTFLKNSSKQKLVPIYNCLAINSRNQYDYKEAIYYYNLAIENTTNNHTRIAIKNNKANTYRDLKEYPKAIQLLDSLQRDTTLVSFPKTKARIIDNLAYTKWLVNRNTKVLPELLNTLEIRQQENDFYGLIASYAHLSDYYKQHNPTTAFNYASKMYDLSKKQKSPQDQLEALEKIIDLDKTSNVQNYFNSYIHISDSIQKAEQKAKNKFAKIKYDSKKNREENLQLKIFNTQNELKIAEEKNKKIIVSVALGVLASIFLGFVYFRKQKLQQEVYKTETRIAKKLHDEVANDMVSIMNKIQYTDNTPEQILDDLEKVYNLTRDISHENNTVETGKNFEIYLKSMLSSFNSNETIIIIKDIHNVELINLAKEKQIEIARVLQELMINMQKHSEASLVAISFKKDKNAYLITYSDNGVGLNMSNLTLRSGLKNVETRIRSINGIINFESELNNGFKVFIGFKNNSYV